MTNYLCIFLSLIALVTACSENENDKIPLFYETYGSKIFCNNDEQIACWGVSKTTCGEAFKEAVYFCSTIESKYVLDQREKGHEVIDPVCLTNKFIDNLEIDENTSEKCDEFSYSKEDMREKFEKKVNT